MTFVQVAARSDCPSIWRNIAQISHAIDASTLLGMRVRARRHSTGESSKLSSFLITAKAALTTAPDNRSRAAPSVLSCSSAWKIDRFKRLNNGEYCGDRKSVVWGKSVSVRVDLGGRRIIKKKKKMNKKEQ